MSEHMLDDTHLVFITNRDVVEHELVEFTMVEVIKGIDGWKNFYESKLILDVKSKMTGMYTTMQIPAPNVIDCICYAATDRVADYGHGLYTQELIELNEKIESMEKQIPGKDLRTVCVIIDGDCDDEIATGAIV